MLSLAEIRPGDLFENPPAVWWTKEITRLQGAQGFHWGLWVSPQDLIATESIAKGTAITRFNYAKSYIYRIKALQDVTPEDIVNAVADYGRSTYGMGENFTTAFNYLVDSWLPQYPWEGPPVPSWLPPWPNSTETLQTFTKPLNTPVNCIQYVILIARRLGYDILPAGQLVIEKNLENSPYLEYLGEFEMDGVPGY